MLSARGSAMFFKATHASTNGAFSLMERTLPPGGRKPPSHIHINCEEAFYVLDGEVEFTLGKEIVVGRRDTFVLVPGGVARGSGVDAARRAADGARPADAGGPPPGRRPARDLLIRGREWI